ncbi:hypothetical protein F4804DRAFT_321753 [Jackrogersella minutella]|nr:hypothetical protein F4804DRAFT_321753 [Jackrogersella minutella]
MIDIGRDDYDVFANRVLWALFGITTIIVILRIICRLRYGPRRRAGIGLDDYITIFCLILSLVVSILITIATGYGLGKHSYELDDQQRTTALKYNVFINAILIWQFSLPKFAIIAILKRILDYGTRTTVAFWTLGITSQACIFAVSVWWFEQCHPIEFGWDKSIEGGTCADVRVMISLAYLASAYSAFLDIFFAFYPIPFIMRLNMPLRSRVAVATAMSLSSLAFVVSIIKLSVLGEAFAISATDPTYPVPYLDILAMAEGYILIICSSLPTLGPLLRAAKVKLTSRDLTTNPSGMHFGSSLHKSLGQSKGQRLPENNECSIAGGNSSSVDDIPLVSPNKLSSSNTRDFGIQKTVDISMTSEVAEPGSYSKQHSIQIF